MARPHDIPDDSDEKWHYTEHTAAKHEILRRYLVAWLAILGRRRRGSAFRHEELVLVDGFAGRGRYIGGESGSPAIMFEQAVRVVEDGLAKRVLIRCAEPSEKNFEHLAEVCAGLKHRQVKIVPRRQTFEEIAVALADWAEPRKPPPPTFVMVDPYGVRGVSLTLVRRLMSIKRLEVLLTFMVRDSSRFLMDSSYEAPLTAFFGGENWRQCDTAADRAACLLLRYQGVVRTSIAQFATPFRVFEDERRTVLYYLVHLTNNDLGMREMKEAMVAKSGEMTFWPITVRPPDQLSLEVEETSPYPSLQAHLTDKYASRTLTFLDLLNDDYPDGTWVEKENRAALTAMTAAQPGAVTVDRTRLTSGGKPATRGIQYPDSITFAGN